MSAAMIKGRAQRLWTEWNNGAADDQRSWWRYVDEGEFAAAVQDCGPDVDDQTIIDTVESRARALFAEDQAGQI